LGCFAEIKFLTPIAMFKKRIVLVDPDVKFLTVASSMIELSEKFVFVNSYQSCEEAIAHLSKDLPDIILMEADFPGMKGTDAILTIKSSRPMIEIIIITNYIDDDIIFDGLSCGATGYLLKSNCVSNLRSHLEMHSRGESAIDPIVARRLVGRIHTNRFSPLTFRETEVMKRIAHGKSYTAIAKELGISSETSKTHIKNIYRKLKVNSKSQAVTKAISDKLIQVGI
jgi:DNA-binding NarL/FixJ family response regulator